MEQFVLILTLALNPTSGSGGASVSMETFESKKACEAAAEEWKKQVVARYESIRAMPEQAYITLCMPKK
ncbi:hypothetical protein [uncultured Microbulbifer sp.]|uniref:hypothetical protein n=1 Tax=uncultured Microbulbifer sp. TaxID=348147 RepID=UPI002610532E|nr:hypothetical protein [uncultured Microbulbifer sp.]